MILEGIVTTVDAAGRVNISPMGPTVGADPARLTLRPFVSSQTYRNLKAHPEGAFHVTDDVELIARAAVGEATAELRPAQAVRGFVLAAACRTHEFRVVSVDDARERAVIDARVVHTTRGRDWFGLNRARHAVLEAAILATRLHLLPRADVERQLRDLQPLVDKTGGEAERRAFRFLLDHAAAHWGPGAGRSQPVRVVTGCRLHLGLIAPWGGGERRFGGAGLMLDRPGVDLTARIAPAWEAEGTQAARALEAGRKLGGGDDGFAARLEVRAAPPDHRGLGSGTQLALAAGRAIAELRGERPTAAELARRTGRGARSAIGIHGFEHGGFLADGGKGPGGADVAPLLLRTAVPPDWRFVLAIPRGELGRHGPAEEASFREPGVEAGGLPERLAHRLVLGLVPALHEGDARAFGQAMTEYSRLAGELFATAQGGIFASPLVTRIVELLTMADVAGAAQSSWGPMVAALAEDADRARWIEGLLRGAWPAADLDVLTAAPLARGALVEKGLPPGASAGTIVAP